VEKSRAARPFIGGAVYHLACRKGDIGKYVLMPGDPDRVDKIASQWDSFRVVSEHRQYRVYSGVYRGVEVTACSSGIGGPSTAIAVEELAQLGAETIIRVGSTGAIQPGIECGELVISTAAVRLDGASKQYIIPEYPAVASYEVVLALIEAAEQLGVRYHVGITASTDSFYTGQGRPGYGGFQQSWMESILRDLRRARVLNFEMEAATLFTLCSIFGLRAGAVCAVYAQRVSDEFEVKGEDEACRVANEAVKILHEMDEEKSRASKRFWHPSLGSL